jgi:ATP-binding cassette subfamily B protein
LHEAVEQLPTELRARIELSWDAEPIQLYALADLDHALVLGETWMALGNRFVSVARKASTGAWEIETVDRRLIRGVQLSPGLSANTLLLVGEPNEPPLATVRYTQRQRGAFENIRFVLDESLAGRAVQPAPEEADRVYADAVARPVRDAQALVAGRESAVIMRLLSYLTPYRRQVAVGLGAAAVVTLASLVPPYLAGFLLDRVVRPAQAGALGHGEAAVGGDRGRRDGSARRLPDRRDGCRMGELGEWVARDLRSELYEHIQRLSLSFFSRKKTGSLITRVTADTDRLWEFIAFGVVDVSLSVVMLLGLGAVLLVLDWRLGLVMTLPVPLFCWLIYWHGESLNARFIRAWRKWSRLTDVLGDTIPAFASSRRSTGNSEIGRFVGETTR